jgi:hypothetical protein
MTRAVETHLKKLGVDAAGIQGVLFFSNPGVHVDALRPAVRIVLMDGIERFTTGILQGSLTYDKEDVQTLVTALADPGALGKKEEAPFEEIPPETSKAPVEPTRSRDPLLAKNINAVSKRFPLTTSQWVLLGIMAFVEVVILVAFILIIITTS